MSNVKHSRPLSPHLQIYKPQLTSVLSIMHRVTGVILSLSLLLFACLIGQIAFEYQLSFLPKASILWPIIMYGLIFSLSYHFYNGIRHLFWDIGKGYTLKATYASGWLVVVLTLITTIGCYLYFQ